MGWQQIIETSWRQALAALWALCYKGDAMNALRLSKSIKRITLLQKDDSGDVTPVVLYEGGEKKKKRS